jgi:hypothetical protein
LWFGRVNWDAIGAVGEVLGALAVIGTLLYLALQVRMSNRYERANHLDIHMDRIRSFRMEIAASADLSRIWSSGLSGNQLSDEDSARFDGLAQVFVLIRRDAWLRSGILGESAGISNRELPLETMGELLDQNPGLLEFWNRNFRNSIIQTEFRDRVNTMLTGDV